MQHRSTYRGVVLVVSGVLILAGLLLLAGCLLPYERLKPLVDHLARDGSLELFTPEFLAKIKPGLLIPALACTAAGGLIIVFRERLEGSLEGLLRASPRRALRREASELGDSLRAELQHRRELGGLAVIIILAAAIRILYLSQPMQHDEAYTFIAFAARPLWVAISDYSLPNNHVFHTLLVFLAYHLLGNQPWIIRLPALIAGVAIIPLTYAAGGIFYSRKVGLLSAGLAAASPLLIDYSANARGYTLICAFTLCAVILAAYVKDHRNTIAWGLLVLACLLGFYTIPIMLYPFGMVVAWLALSKLFGDTSPAYGRSLWVTLAVACLILFGLTALLYTPVFIRSGIEAVVNNSYVRPDDTGGLLEQVWSRIAGTAEQWSAGVPWQVGILSLTGFIASLALYKRISRQKVPLQIAAILWIAIAVSLQRVAPLARVWMFLLPLYLTWATAGILGLARLATPERLHKRATGLVFLAALLLPAVVMVATIPRTEEMRGTPGAEEGVARYLQAHLSPGDRVAVQSPISIPLQYYFQQSGLPSDPFDTQATQAQKVWVVVSRRYDQTLESVLKRRGLEALMPGTPPSPAYQYKHISVYELSP
jgi:hypothetical protein